MSKLKCSKDRYVQKLFETAIEIKGVEYVLQELCKYISEEDKRDFIGYFCDDENCFTPDIEDYL